MLSSCIPPIKSMITTVEAQPATGSPNTSLLIMIKSIAIIATIKLNTPAIEAMYSGALENATIPSRLYKKSCQNDHFVSPATLFTFSNSSHFTLKPTQPNSPFENLLYSLSESSASTYFLFISL